MFITRSLIDNARLCSFNIEHSIFGKLNLNSRTEYNGGFKRLHIELKNMQNKLLAREELSLEYQQGKMQGFNIVVEPEYRNNGRRNFRFGEIIRLASIIEMLENQKNLFKIFSKSTAVFFHSKYKFEPDIVGFHERNSALESIASKKDGAFGDLVQKSRGLLKKISISSSPEIQRELCREANELIKEYIKRVEDKKLQRSWQYSFSHGMDMALTSDNIIKNRAFYNELFKKHGIDYTI